MNIGIKYKNNTEIPEELFLTNYKINKDLVFPKLNSKGISILKNFEKINFFIGANNSGKSRFLRGVFKLNKPQIEVFKGDASILELFSNVKNIYGRVLNYSSRNMRNIRNNIENYAKLSNIDNRVDILKYLTSKIDLELFTNLENEILFEIESLEKKGILQQDINYLNNVKEIIKLNKILSKDLLFHQENIISKRKYIPVLRYANANDNLNKSTFLETIKENYKIETDVFIGLDLFDSIRHLQGEEFKIQERKDKFEEFLSINFFDNQRIKITSSNDKRKIRFLIGDEERFLWDLGDGLQSIILLMFPIFTASNNDWIFIDEPENHLHPGYQKIFLRTILEDEYLKKKNLKLFMTTHSNHFLDASILSKDVSIFQFEKINEKSITIEYLKKPTKDTLDILGVSNSSVLIANSSIWVEGPTDRKYLSYWLRQYSINKGESPLIEDIDFAFFEYGGSLISHYLFDDKFNEANEIVKEEINSFAISNKIYLLADNDNAKGTTKKGKRKKELEILSKNKKNFKYQNTEVVEIENLLPSKIILSFSKILLKEERLFDEIKELKIKQSDFKKIGLGKFYEDLFVKNGIPKTSHKAFKAISGTLNTSYKFRLCDFLIESGIDYKELINENLLLNKIIKELYRFVKQ